MIALYGLGGGFLLFWLIHRIKFGGFQTLGNQIIHRAEIECESMRSKLELELKEREHRHAQQLEKKERKLQEMESLLQERLKETEGLERAKKRTEKETLRLDKEQGKISEIKATYQQKLKELVSIDPEVAKARYVEKIEAEMGLFLHERKEAMEVTSEREGAKILATVIGRLALQAVTEGVVTTLELPNSEIKGRIIGREGRNVRLLEQLTGVNYLFDETPGAVVISSADPVRRMVAKQALTTLIRDGRIHASRIEEVVERSKKSVEHQGIAAAEKAALKAGVIDLHPELIAHLGSLHYRYSLGQNLLEHSLEVSGVMRLIAAELKLDEALAARIGLLHDLGKVVPHDEGLSHSAAGAKLALKYGESADVANGIEAHHGEVAPLTIEAQFVSVADTISAGRPGARSEAIERYVHRLSSMEKICLEHEEVEKAYALQAGREVRVIVQPDRVSDSAATALARTLVKKLEKELSFSGKIKVTVIREKKIIDYAS